MQKLQMSKLWTAQNFITYIEKARFKSDFFFFFIPSFSLGLLQIKKSNLLQNLKLSTVITQVNPSPTSFYMEINKISFEK